MLGKEVPAISPNITGCTRWLHLSSPRKVAEIPAVCQRAKGKVMPKNNKARSRTGMKDTMLTCSMCDESFNSEHELRDHQQTVHAAEVRNLRRSRENDPDEDEQETAA